MSNRRSPSDTQVRRRLARYPRCAVCRQPMCCGQKDTHLSCAANEQTEPEGRLN